MDYLIPLSSVEVLKVVRDGATTLDIALTQTCRWRRVQVGDRLLGQERIERMADEYHARYAADGAILPGVNWAWPTKCALTAPFMPRGCCRLKLRVTGLERPRVDLLRVTFRWER